MNCTNCNQEASSTYCPNCGQPTQLKRIDAHYIQHEIVHLFHLEKGFFYTIRELLVRPGKSIRSYISENRIRLTKPIIFIIVTSLIYTLSANYFHFEDGYVGFSGNNESVTGAMFKWIQEHYGYANILMGIFIALWTKLFFRKQPYNLFEIIVLLCFTMGMGMLFLSIFGAIEGLTKLKVLQFGAYALFIYIPWAIGQFYDQKKALNYVKALFAYILGMISFYAILLVIGGIIDNL